MLNAFGKYENEANAGEVSGDRDLTDISFYIGGHKFNYRVAAIIQHDKKYLLTTMPDLDFWFLPGGRVRTSESSIDALTRELQEELGVECQVNKLLWLVENFFTLKGEDFHEVCIYFLASLPPSANFAFEDSFTTAPDLRFRWSDFEGLQQINLQPRFLKSKLAETHQGFDHIVFRD